MNEKTDVYQEVTDRIITALEAGTVPWRKPWTRIGRPRSMSTGKTYNGVNVLLLGMSGHGSPFWGTYRQIGELGGQVRKGEKSSLVTFWKELTKEDTDAGTGEVSTKRIPMLRQFRCFNADQADDLPARFYPEPRDVPEISQPQAVMNAYLRSGNAAELRHDVHGQAYYDPAADVIRMPPIGEHRTAADYYSTGFHEIAHSTGHGSRLARVGVTEATATFGSHTYGKEELCAQMGASFLLAETGIDGDQVMANSAAYCASWLALFRDDKKLIISAAAAGQKIADLVMEPTRQAIAAEPEPEPDRDLVIMRAAMARVAGRDSEHEAA